EFRCTRRSRRAQRFQEFLVKHFLMWVFKNAVFGVFAVYVVEVARLDGAGCLDLSRRCPFALPTTISDSPDNRQRSEAMNGTTILDQVANELPTALAALDAGDQEIVRYTRGVRQLLDGVTSKS